MNFTPKTPLLFSIKLLTFLIALTLPPHLFAANLSFSLKVHPDTGTSEDYYELAVIIDGAQPATAPTLTESADFKVDLIGPQSSIQIINGNYKASVIYKYRLTPTKVGDLLTPGAKIEIDGETYTAAGVRVKVVAPAKGSDSDRTADIFLRQSIDKKYIYVGEQVIHTLELNTRLPVRELSFVPVSFEGFWAIDLSKPTQSSKIINGSRYQVVKQSRALYPIKSGDIDLPTPKANVIVKAREQQNRRSPQWDPFGGNAFDNSLFENFFGNYLEKQLTSNSLAVTVLPLPEIPANFPRWGNQTVIVGNTSLELRHTGDPINFGEGKNLELRIFSFGNLTPYSKISLDLAPDIKLYQDPPKEEQSQQSDRILTTKIFNFTIVPAVGGQIMIPPIRLGYFDPDDEQFKVAETSEISITVNGGPKQTEQSDLNSVPVGPTTDKLPIIKPTTTPLSSDHLAYLPKTALESISEQISLSLSILIIAVLLLILLAVRAAYRAIGALNARRTLQKKLDNALSIADIREVFLAILTEKVEIEDRPYSSEELKAIVKTRLNNPNLTFLINSFLERLDHFTYSPAAPSANDLLTCKEQLKDLLRGLAPH